MRKQILLFLFVGVTIPLWGQHLSFQSTKCDTFDCKTLFERITKIEKKTDKLHLFLNTHGSFNVYPNSKANEENGFKINQLRIEAKGHITDRIYYRYRQRLNRSNQAQSMDNMPFSIDYAAIGFQITPKLSVFAGKQSTCYGGFEFDMNPIEVYEYSDMLEYMKNFLTGVDLSYWITDNHELRFQVVDARNNSFSEMYGVVPKSVTRPKTPLGYTLNWNGSFWENLIKTRWSASIFHDATNKNMYYYALGTELNLKKFNMFVDFMYSDEMLDRKGIISDMAYHAGYEERALYAKYMTFVARFNYRIFPKWNAFIKGTYETASVYRTNGELEKGKYRTSYGYLGGIEFYPMKENLHFYATYVGRSYDYTSRGKALGMANTNPQRIALGFIYQIPLF